MTRPTQRRHAGLPAVLRRNQPEQHAGQRPGQGPDATGGAGWSGLHAFKSTAVPLMPPSAGPRPGPCWSNSWFDQFGGLYLNAGSGRGSPNSADWGRTTPALMITMNPRCRRLAPPSRSLGPKTPWTKCALWPMSCPPAPCHSHSLRLHRGLLHAALGRSAFLGSWKCWSPSVGRRRRVGGSGHRFA